MEPDFGLVDHMCSYGILSALTADEISSAQSSYGRNEIILRNIVDCNDRGKQEAFCRALAHCRQQHIVNFVDVDGGIHVHYLVDLISRSAHGSLFVTM